VLPTERIVRCASALSRTSTEAFGPSRQYSEFELSQPTLSHHLKKLLAAGLVERERHSNWAYYSINRDALRRLSTVVGQGG
jgi:DNA-binding transcriptional ArsR family regulator